MSLIDLNNDTITHTSRTYPLCTPNHVRNRIGERATGATTTQREREREGERVAREGERGCSLIV